MGWDALAQWGTDVARIERLTGGVANEVWSVRVNGQLAVARLGARSDADLAWETQLMRYLDAKGLSVPLPIPTTSGRDFADGHQLDILCAGIVVIDDDVSPDLADRGIGKVRVLGSLRGPKAVLERLASRTTKGKRP